MKQNQEELPTEGNFELKPFDKVLARDIDCQTWQTDMYSHYDSNEKVHICIGHFYNQCIPLIRINRK